METGNYEVYWKYDIRETIGIYNKRMNVVIDFDEASTCWRMNKRRVKHGSFVYICTHICKNDKQCSNKADITIDDVIFLCKYHKWVAQE